MDSSFAAETVGSNHDLLIQILMCLSTKSLMCFKSVSNAWLFLITQHDRSWRALRTPDSVLGIFMRMKIRLGKREEYRLEYIPLNPNHRYANKSPILREFFTCPCPPRGEMILSCNGLLLCYDFESYQYNVFNPTTLSYTILPNHPRWNQLGATPNWNEFTSVGFAMAFDRVTSHYKIIVVSPIQIHYSHHRKYEIVIYSSETSTWSNSRVINEAAGGLSIMLDNGVYWNGSVYWIITGIGRGTGKILSFHVDSLALHRIPDPPVRASYTSTCNHYFGETCGHLHYIEPGVNGPMLIYEMKTDYSEWFIKSRINLTSNYNWSGGFQLLSLVRFEEEKDDPVLVLWVGNRVVMCNLVDRKFKTLREFPSDYQPGLDYVQKYSRSDKRVAVFPRFRINYGFPFIPSLSDT